MRRRANGKLVVLAIAMLALGVAYGVFRYLSAERVPPVKVDQPR